MAFERFTEVGRVFRPRASLRSNGQIGFNHGSVKRFEMEKFTHAILFYDAETKRIGVKLTNEKDEPGASALMTRSGNGTLSARAFLEFYQLTPKTTTQYDIERDNPSGLLVINIAKITEKP
jgi:hypothetical protein